MNPDSSKETRIVREIRSSRYQPLNYKAKKKNKQTNQRETTIAWLESSDGSRNRVEGARNWDFTLVENSTLDAFPSSMWADRGRHPLIAPLVCWMVLRFQVDPRPDE